MSKIHLHAIDLVRHKGKLASTLVLAFTVAPLFTWLRLPLPWMLGPLFATTVAVILGFSIWMPGWLRLLIVGVLGVIFATVFSPNFVEHAVLFAWLTTSVSEMVFLALILAFAPGGLAEMTIVEFGPGADIALIVSN